MMENVQKGNKQRTPAGSSKLLPPEYYSYIMTHDVKRIVCICLTELGKHAWKIDDSGVNIFE